MMLRIENKIVTRNISEWKISSLQRNVINMGRLSHYPNKCNKPNQEIDCKGQGYHDNIVKLILLPLFNISGLAKILQKGPLTSFKNDLLENKTFS
jgi:hypothetical protein